MRIALWWSNAATTASEFANATVFHSFANIPLLALVLLQRNGGKGMNRTGTLHRLRMILAPVK